MTFKPHSYPCTCEGSVEGGSGLIKRFKMIISICSGPSQPSHVDWWIFFFPLIDVSGDLMIVPLTSHYNDSSLIKLISCVQFKCDFYIYYKRKTVFMICALDNPHRLLTWTCSSLRLLAITKLFIVDETTNKCLWNTIMLNARVLSLMFLFVKS